MSPVENGPDRELGETEREQLLRYMAGDLGASETAAFEARVLADPALARALYREQGLSDALGATVAGSVTQPAARAVRRVPIWWPRGQALLAAAVVIGVAGTAVLLMRGPRSERMRGAGGETRLIAPRGPLAEPPIEFRWSRHPEAVQYRFELFDGAGRVVQVALTQDTTFRAASSAGGLQAPPEGTWRVVPLAAGGHELAAPPAATYRSR